VSKHNKRQIPSQPPKPSTKPVCPNPVPVSGDETIITLANKLLEAIAKQGYCVRFRDGYGHVDICIFGIDTTETRLKVENLTNMKGEWEVKGKLTANLR
jgi:hypothetical protein